MTTRGVFTTSGLSAPRPIETPRRRILPVRSICAESAQNLSDGARRHAAPQGGTGDGAVVSSSPELFLRFDPSDRTLTTRPMKGTRPAAR